MRTRLLPCTLLTLLLSGCIDTYEEQYLAAQQEIAALKLELAEARRKLKAADNEVRHKIFTLARRANNYLQSTSFDAVELTRLQQELAVHLDSYTQLNGSADQVALVARFYTAKLSAMLTLQRDATRAYDRQYNSCLSDLDGQGKKNELSTMLCEVQADVARKDPLEKLNASIAAVLSVGKGLLDSDRQEGVAAMSLEQLEQQFQARLAEITTKISG